MKIKVMLNLLLTYFSLVAPEIRELSVSKNVTMPCDENMKYNLLLSWKVNQ